MRAGWSACAVRWVKPEQIADLVAFLLSDHSSAITGALIPIVGRV